MWNIFKQSDQYKVRKHYQQLRAEAQEAEKSGDRKRYVALNAIADRMIDRAIYS